MIKKESLIKDLIVEILTENYPLTIKEVYRIIKKDYKRDVSYQGVYKIIFELLEKNVIAKEQKGYLLSKDYIKRLNLHINKINLNYNKGEGILSELEQKGFIIKKLNNQYEMALFLIDFLKTAKKGEMINIIWPVVWPTLTVKEIYEPLKEIGKKVKGYCLCSSDSFLDKRFSGYWKNLGMNLKLGAKIETIFETFILRDMVLLVYQPSDVRVRKHRYLSVLRNITHLEMDKIFLEVIKEKTEIYVFIIKSQPFADKLRQEIMDHF